MENKFNYHLLRLLFYLHVENIHRWVFDYLYQQDYQIKLKDKFLLNYYKLLCKIAPEFRPFLKYYKYIFKRVYNQNRINCIKLFLYYKLKKINTERYASK